MPASIRHGASAAQSSRATAKERRPDVFTIGHSTRALNDFIALLDAHAVTCLIDVRTVPRSRHNPQFNRDTLPSALSTAGIAYVHAAGLGGFRRPSASSPNQGWRNMSFRGYADYMQSADFAHQLSLLIAQAQRETPVLMCAEAVPWRCHRSLIADALLVHGIDVAEILDATRYQRHRLTSFARIVGTQITYPHSGSPRAARAQASSAAPHRPPKSTARADDA